MTDLRHYHVFFTTTIVFDYMHYIYLYILVMIFGSERKGKEQRNTKGESIAHHT